MADIRLAEKDFALDGKVYKLRCNFNVLADAQEAFGGKLLDSLDGRRGLKSTLVFLAAMLNDYADEQGWPECFTAKSLGRKLSFAEVPSAEVIELVVAALKTGDDPDEADTEKN